MPAINRALPGAPLGFSFVFKREFSNYLPNLDQFRIFINLISILALVRATNYSKSNHLGFIKVTWNIKPLIIIFSSNHSFQSTFLQPV